MLVPEFFDNYRSGNLSSKKFFCNEQKITEGLEAFTEAYYNSSIKADTQDRILKLFHMHDEYYYGYNRTSKKEDNMMYDLNFDYDGDSSDGVEKEFNDFMSTFSSEMGKIKRQIEDCMTLVQKYNSGEYTGEEVEEILGRINEFYLDVPLPEEPEKANTASGGNTGTRRSSYGGTARAISRSSTTPTNVEPVKVEDVKQNQTTQQDVMKTDSSKNNTKNVNSEITTKTSDSSDKKAKGQLVSSVTSDNIKNDFKNASSTSTSTSSAPKNKLANSVLDLIANGKQTANIDETVEKVTDEVKKASGKITSSISNLKNFNGGKIIPKIVENNNGEKNTFIPPIAGLSAAAVAGLGTKLYIDKDKDNDKDKKDDESEENKFFKDIDEEEEQKNDSLSKEDLITILENKS